MTWLMLSDFGAKHLQHALCVTAEGDRNISEMLYFGCKFETRQNSEHVRVQTKRAYRMLPINHHELTCTYRAHVLAAWRHRTQVPACCILYMSVNSSTPSTCWRRMLQHSVFDHSDRAQRCAARKIGLSTKPRPASCIISNKHIVNTQKTTVR